MKVKLLVLSAFATALSVTAAYAQSDIDSLRQTCMDSSVDPDTRIQACNQLSNAITEAVAAGNYSGNAILDTANAQAAAMRAIGDKAAQARNGLVTGQQNKSGQYGNNWCEKYNGSPASRQPGAAGIAC